MSKLDEKKAKLDELRVYRNFALTSLLALVAFLGTKRTEADVVLLVVSALSVFGLGIGIFALQKRILKIIKEIGEL